MVSCLPEHRQGGSNLIGGLCWACGVCVVMKPGNIDQQKYYRKQGRCCIFRMIRKAMKHEFRKILFPTTDIAVIAAAADGCCRCDDEQKSEAALKQQINSTNTRNKRQQPNTPSRIDQSTPWLSNFKTSSADSILRT